MEARLVDQGEPIVDILSPLPGELWKPGETHTIRWTVTDDDPIANIKVNYLFDGENREEITNGLAGVDSLEWLVPDTKSLYCYAEVIVTDIAGNDGYGYNQDPFIADYTPLYHAAFMNPDYLGGHNLGYLDIRQQFGADGGVFLPDTVHPQISSDPDTRRVFVLDDLDGPYTSLTTIDLRGAGSVQTVTPYTPAGFMGLAWDPFTEKLYTMLRPEGSSWPVSLRPWTRSTWRGRDPGYCFLVPPTAFGLDMIAIAPNGEVYGLSDRQGSPSLWRVDRETLRAQLVGSFGPGGHTLRHRIRGRRAVDPTGMARHDGSPFEGRCIHPGVLLQCATGGAHPGPMRRAAAGARDDGRSLRRRGTRPARLECLRDAGRRHATGDLLRCRSLRIDAPESIPALGARDDNYGHHSRRLRLHCLLRGRPRAWQTRNRMFSSPCTTVRCGPSRTF